MDSYLIKANLLLAVDRVYGYGSKALDHGWYEINTFSIIQEDTVAASEYNKTYYKVLGIMGYIPILSLASGSLRIFFAVILFFKPSEKFVPGFPDLNKDAPLIRESNQIVAIMGIWRGLTEISQLGVFINLPADLAVTLIQKISSN